MRKHFETSARRNIGDGQMIKSGLGYNIRFMDQDDVPHSVALQRHTLAALRAIGKQHFIIEKNEQTFRRLLDAGHALVGTFLKDPATGQETRLAAHMVVLYPVKPEDSGYADPSLLPAGDIQKITVVSNVLVHQDFRGNALMQRMLKEWLKMAAADGKKHAAAEVCADNPFSWDVFLEAGFVIYAAAHDPRDGSDNFYLHKPLDRRFLYSASAKDTAMVRLFDARGNLDAAAHDRIKALLRQGYHAIDYDRGTNFVLLAKCTGTAPLHTPPRPPGNDNTPR